MVFARSSPRSRSKLKDNGVTLITFTVRRFFEVVLFVDHFAKKTETFIDLPKEEKAFSFSSMGSYGEVTALKHHVTDLPLAKLFEYAVVTGPVGISVGEAFFPVIMITSGCCAGVIMPPCR